MRVTTISCDKCKKVDPEEVYRAQCIASSGPYVHQGMGSFKSKEVDLCRECMTILFDFGPKKGSPPKPDPKPTALEIVEMLADALRLRNEIPTYD